MQIHRLTANPIITPESSPSIGTNINGPSLIRVPDWIPNPLGRYYLYFAHHEGTFIRLAFADHLQGPWHVHEPGTLRLDQTPCIGHIASPDLHIDEAERRIIMYYHGPVTGLSAPQSAAGWGTDQRSFVATSRDGLEFTSQTEALGPSYFRVFPWQSWTVAMSMPGIFLRSGDGFSTFSQGPVLFDSNMRHAALLRRNNTLFVFFSSAGDAPEHIKVSRIQLTDDWMNWTATVPKSLLWPAHAYEGTEHRIAPSIRGASHAPVHEVRDPAVYIELSDGEEEIYLLYSVAGERGIAVARLSGVEE